MKRRNLAIILGSALIASGLSLFLPAPVLAATSCAVCLSDCPADLLDYCDTVLACPSKGATCELHIACEGPHEWMIFCDGASR